MCGISGIYKLNRSTVDKGVLSKMTDVIEHRGPDGFGYWFNNEDTVGFGHRRLSIIDLSNAGKQPMEYMGLTITFNGEIYNYLELKKDLISKGYNFVTETDTEVLLALYHLKGKACLKELDGMFSFAIWDDAKKELFCARDRFGEKPFYYYIDPTQFIFGSEIKQIFCAGISKEVNPEMLHNYCVTESLVNVLDPKQTFYHKIEQLPQSHSLLITQDGSLKIEKYWDIDYRKTESDFTFEQATERFNELLSLSIKRRLRSDVLMGTSLSGGLDSTTIAGYICREDTTFKLNTFTASFPGFEKDETRFISIFKRRYPKILDHYVAPTEEDFIRDIDKLFFHQDEPIGSTSIYAQYRVMQLARQNGVTVLLDGQGADEYLGGYNQFWPVRLRELYINDRKKHSEEAERVKQLTGLQQNIGFNLAFMLQYPKLHNTMSAAKKALLFKKTPPTKQMLNPSYYLADKKNESKSVNWSDLNSVLYNSLLSSGLQDLLRFADRNSMAHSVEVRLPFLSHELVEFVFSLPSAYKMNEGWSKRLLRQSQNTNLPEEICWRREKVGYATPQKQWMQNNKLAEKITEARQNLRQSGKFDRTFIEQAEPWKILNLSYMPL